MSSCKNLPGPQLARLTARLLLFEAILENYERTYNTHSNPIIRQFSEFEDFAIRAADGPYPLPVNGIPRLEIYLRKYIETLSPLYGGSTNPLIKAVMDGISQKVESFACDQCNPDWICQGNEESIFKDDKSISIGGRCVKSIKTLFNFTFQEVSTIYNRHVNFLKLSNLECCIGYQIDNPNLAPQRMYYVTGKTQHLDNIEIHLIHIFPGYSLSCFLASLYVLFHEVVSHAYCGLPLESESSVISENFAEGWMDYVAFELLRESIDIDIPPIGPIRCPIPVDRFLEHGKLLHEQRCNVEERHRNVETVRAAEGNRAAKKLFTAFKNVLNSPSQAWEHFLRFSLNINASKLSDEMRGELVARINQILPGYGQRDPYRNNANYPKIERIISHIYKYSSSHLFTEKNLDEVIKKLFLIMDD